MTKAIVSFRRALRIFLAGAVVIVPLASSCSFVSVPWSAASSPTRCVQPDSPAAAVYRVSGIVTDDSRRPLPDSEVVIDYVGKDPSSRWIGTHTDDDGRYAVTFCSDEREFKGVKGAIGVVSAYSPGYFPHVQLLSAGAAATVQDLRLRPLRTTNAGQSFVASIDADSSRAVDLEHGWFLSDVWERFRVAADKTGNLIVEARSQDGDVLPTVDVSCAPAGTACGPGGAARIRAAGSVSIPVRAGGLYEVRVAVLHGAGPQRYNVLTSLR